MNVHGLLSFSAQPFKLGPRVSNLYETFGKKTLLNLDRKFDIPSAELAIALIEITRFLFLAAYSPRTLFFPGDKLMDDLWHALIIETESYKNLCDRLKVGSFVHHSGVPFGEYTSALNPNQIHEEQCSWLASYVENFGPITPDAFKHLNLAQSLALRIEGDLLKVNRLAEELLEIAKQNLSPTPFVFENFLEEIREQAATIDSDPETLSFYLGVLHRNIGSCRAIEIFENVHLEKLFGASTAMAFTYWQHLAATERLANLPEWRAKSPDKWQQLRSNHMLVGLITTHLANPAGAGVIGHEVQGGFHLNGKASWVCGYRIFDYVIVGFDTGDKIVFALSEFPRENSQVSISRLDLACLKGTATIEIQFDGYFIAQDQLISERIKTSEPPSPRPSKFITPEIGIASSLLEKIEAIVQCGTHPKLRIISNNLSLLKDRLIAFGRLRAGNAPLETLSCLRDDLNRDAVRLLAIALGANSIRSNSLVPRLQNELLLLDAVLQSPATIEMKIISICEGRRD